MNAMDLPVVAAPRLLDAMDPVFVTLVGVAPGSTLDSVQDCTGGSGDGDSGGEIGDTD